MFTGLIEEVGHVQEVKMGNKSAQFRIGAKKILSDTEIGDSISTNGTCLTVVAKTPLSFTVDIMHETIKATNFARLNTGAQVNLERAMTLSNRLGGHLVSGHIDGIGTITSIQKNDIAWLIQIKSSPDIIDSILPKGSIAIDGVSLTIVQVLKHSFEISIIPHTAKKTTLVNKKIGDKVNIETDMIGKYVFRFLSQKQANTPTSNIDLNLLQKNGFI